jgi:hypothetical protein
MQSGFQDFGIIPAEGTYGFLVGGADNYILKKRLKYTLATNCKSFSAFYN